ncbi:hypothetical protein Tco_0613745 [Tanacetum coccineum]
MEELTTAVMLMARIQPADGNAETVPSYDAKVVSEVNASSKVHDQMSHVKRKTIIHTSDDDQIDFNIIFDDHFVENNGAKKAFKERENQYLEDICDLEEKLSSHDRIVYKMGQSIQTIHMLGKTPNKVYDPFLKARLGYKNSERLKKAIAAEPKMYNGDMLHSGNLKIDSPDSEETLEDAEESRLKMRKKRKSNVKRALSTTPVATKSRNLGTTSVVVKSRLSVAKTPKATNKVFSALSLSHDSSQSKTLSNYMKNKIATSRKWQRWFEYQQIFNWLPKSKTAQSLPSETKSRIRVCSTSKTPVTTQKWVAKLSILPSAFVSCDAGDSAHPLDS